MKKIFLVLSGIFILHLQVLLAQKTGTVRSKSSTAVTTISKEAISSLPFSKGQWEYSITKENLNYAHQKAKVNDVSQGTQSQFSINADANYYVAKSIGIGLQLDADWNTYKFNGKSNNNSWMTYANVTYGINGNNNFNFYLRGGVGVGSANNKYTPPNGSSTNNKSDLFGYKLAVGFPIQMGGSPAYFTPELSYGSRREKFDASTETDNHFGVGLKLETFLFCKEMQCDAHKGHALSHNSYTQGRSYLGVHTRGMFTTGDIKTEYNNNFPDTKDKYTQGDLQANYMYYIVNYLALGASLDFGTATYKNDASNNKQTIGSFSFMPMLELNMPSDNKGLNNLFVRGGYGFGTQRTEYTSGNTTNTTKYSTTDFCVGLGYNFFFHKGLSFTPIFDYDMATSKEKNSNIKQKFNGPELSIGVRKFF